QPLPLFEGEIRSTEVPCGTLESVWTSTETTLVSALDRRGGEYNFVMDPTVAGNAVDNSDPKDTPSLPSPPNGLILSPAQDGAEDKSGTPSPQMRLQVARSPRGRLSGRTISSTRNISTSRTSGGSSPVRMPLRQKGQGTGDQQGESGGDGSTRGDQAGNGQK
ncbi:unnamed protein product, partial [Discosporangium mesarthrocarpum]